MPIRPRLERDYTISDEHDNADEPDPRYQRGFQYRRPRALPESQRPSQRQRSRRRIEEPQEGYDIPDDHTEPDEIVGPSSVEHPPSVRDDVLGSRRPREDNVKKTSYEQAEEPQEVYDVPDNYTELDELAAPPPVESRRDTRQHVLESRLSRKESADKVPYEHAQEPQENCDMPDSYTALDELAAPSPVENRMDTRRDVLENRLSRNGSPKQGRKSGGRFSGQEHNITELIVPPPSGSDPHESKESAIPKPVVKDSRHHDRRERVSRFATELYTVSYLIIFSILGTLARLGLQALTFYPGAPIQFGLLWANFAGSLLMGFLSEDQKLFREHLQPSTSDRAKHNDDEEKGDPSGSDTELRPHIAAAQKDATSKQQIAVKKTIPLYVGLATGFCGSFTSFSSFIRDAYLALSNALPVPVSHTSPAPVATGSTVPRNGGYSFMAICAVIIVTVILCLGALLLGAHLAIALEPLTPGIPQLVARRIVDRMVVLIAWGAWLGAVMMAIWPPDRPGGPVGHASWAQEFWRGDALFALVFAPLGCLLRFYTSLHLNGKIQSFPLGTFTVNIFGTAMEGMFYDLQHVPLGGRVGCQIMQGLMDGFCGGLTTVSTWVAELKGLRMRHAYVYGTVSVGVGVGIMVIIVGSLQWTLGFHAPLCGH